MKISPSLRSGVADVLSGILGLMLLLGLDFATTIKFDMRLFFIAGAVFCCALGFLRGGDLSSRWVKTLMIASGFCLPVLVLVLIGKTFGGPEIVGAFLVVSFLSIGCGVFAQSAWTHSRRIATAAFILLPVACTAVSSMMFLPGLMGKISGQHVDQPAPEFSLVTGGGKQIDSAELKGKVVVLAFWATWCEPCWQELPKIEKVYTSYKDNQHVVFWAVNARAGGDTDATAQAFAKKMRLEIPVAYTENETAGKLGVEGYPTLVLLDAAGHVRFIHNGYDGSEHLESDLAREIANLAGERS
jgi:thiol-disulfide isomerase/thioredoxin